MNIHKKALLLLSLLLISLASCKVSRNYKQPDLSVAGLYRDQPQTDTLSLAQSSWQQLFTDPDLQGLINEGLAQNLDLKIALQKIVAAQAALQQSKQVFLPSLQADANAGRIKQSEAALNFSTGNTLTTNYKLQFSTTWEADIWGKLGSAKRAALADYLQTDAAKRAIQTQLIADISLRYYTLLALDEQLAITEKTLAVRKRTVATMKTLKEGAVVTGAAVVQSEANQYAAEVAIPDLKRSIRETENALNILLARAPGPVKRGSLARQQLNADMKTGIPVQLLANRPDIQQAELAFRAAFENTNMARSYFYPALTLSAAGGLSSLQLKDFFNQSVFYNFLGGLTQPIFNKGLNKMRLKTTLANQEQALLAFQKRLLLAGQEVSDAMYSYETAREKETARVKQIEALTKAVDYTEQLLRYSSATNYTDVLTSEQSLLNAELSAVSDQLQKLQAVVNLYRALGGGWK